MAPGCEDEYPQGVTAVDGVPIVDVISSGIRLAEVLASFRNSGLSWISRSGMYRRPDDDLFVRSLEEFPFTGRDVGASESLAWAEQGPGTSIKCINLGILGI